MHRVSTSARRTGLLVLFLVGSTVLSSTQQSGIPLALSERPGGSTILGSVTDGHGGLWVVGSAGSGTLTTTPDALKRENTSTNGTSDAFLAHLGADGAVVYATYFGGSHSDLGLAIARDAAGNLYAAGTTSSADFPTSANALRTTSADGDRNAFVTKFDPTGTHIVYSTYLGGSGFEEAYGIAVDAAGVAHVVGRTSGTDFPVTAGQRCLNLWMNAFYTRLAADGSSIAFSGCLDDSAAYGVALDAIGDAYVVGSAGARFGPRMNALKVEFPAGAGSQGFLAKFSGESIPFSTYLGGESSDVAA